MVLRAHLSHVALFAQVLLTHMARLTRQPKEVETARGERLSPEKSLVKEEVRAMRGRSSATTTHVRMHDRSTERCFSWGTELPRPLVHSSITPAVRSTKFILYSAEKDISESET